MKIGPTLGTLLATAALSVGYLLTHSMATLYWCIAFGVFSCVNLCALLAGNREAVGTVCGIYGRIKISDTPFFTVSRDKLKRTQWLELGTVENAQGDMRVFTITIFHLTAQLGRKRKREVPKENTDTEYTFSKNGKTVYKGNTVPEEMHAAMQELEAARDMMFAHINRPLKNRDNDKDD